MKAGDPKKAVILAVIAIVVVSAAVFRSIPKGSVAPQALRAANTPAGKTTFRTPADLPEAVYTNPFYHPSLSVKKVTKPPSPPAGTTSHMAGPGSPILSPVPGHLPDGVAPALPEVSNRGSQQSKQEPKKHSVAVQAVLKVHSYKAMISVDGKPPLSLEKGDTIIDGIVLAEVQEGFVILKTAKGLKKLSVGQQLEI